MNPEDCNLLTNFNERYQSEVDERGHNIPKRLAKAKAKNDLRKIQEYETDLQIAENLQRLTQSCTTKKGLSKSECKQLSEGIKSWNYELEYWTNKWYIKPFVSKKKKEEGQQYVQQLYDLNQKLCQKN